MTKRTKTELTSQVSGLLPDNNLGEISPSDIRSVFTDVGDSLVFWDDTAPASMTATGVVGEMKISSVTIGETTIYHLYVCVATDTWRRSELVSFQKEEILNMSAMSDYLEAAICNHVLRNTAFTTPGDNVYVGLIKYYDSAVVEAGTLTQEASGGAYARQQVNGTGAWTAPGAAGATSNVAAITFPTATADWDNISGVIIADAASAGNVLLHGSLTTARDVKDGDVFKFNIGDLDITFA